MNTPTLMVKVAGLLGHPLPISTHPAAFDDSGSIHLPADIREQAARPSRVRAKNNIRFARAVRPDGRERPLRLDLLMPEAPGRHPLVVYIPGGGFVRAAKAGGRRMRRYIAAAGYVVASIEYRTTLDGATYRDGMSDVWAAVGHLTAHADEYGVDPQRIALWGESAGGYLAAMVGVTARSERGEEGNAILAVIDKFGGSALDRLAEGFDEATIAAVYAPGNSIARYVNGPEARLITDDPDALRAADPAAQVTPDAPAFLLFHGSDDRIISPVQTGLLHHALRAADVPSAWYIVDGAGHGDLAVKGGEEKYWTTEPMLRLLADFLDRETRQPVTDR